MTVRTLLSITLLAALSGCLSIDAPAEFLVVREASDEIRLITADEAKLWVREFVDDDDGDLDFWSKALRGDLVDNRGYTLLESRQTTDDAGRPAFEMLLEATVAGRTQRYLVTLSVHERTLDHVVRVSEFVAEKERFDAYLDGVREAVASVRP